MRQRFIICGALVLVAGWVVYLVWSRSGEELERPQVGEQAKTVVRQKRNVAEGAVVASLDASLVGEGARGAGDALYALPADAESWRRAVQNYSDADDAARGERQHVRVTAAQIEQVVDGAPLTAGDRVRLRELLVSKRLARVDLELSARKHGLTAKGSKFDALVKAEEDRLDQQIKTLVGESYFGEIKKPWGVRGELRIYTVEFVGEVSRRGMRLSDGQAEALTGLVDELKEDESRLPVDPSTGLTVFDEQMLGGAKQMLSPAQLDIFRRVRIDTNLSRVAMELKKQRRLKEKAQQEAGAN